MKRKQNTALTLWLIALAISLIWPAAPSHAKGSSSAAAASALPHDSIAIYNNKKVKAKKPKKPRQTLKQLLAQGDSLRLQMRHAADNGYMLQWGDTMLRERIVKGEMDSTKYNRYMGKLRKMDGHLKRLDNLLAKKYSKIKYDTLYIARPAYRWTIKFRANLSGSRVKTRTENDNIDQETDLRAAYRGTLSVGIAYRGLGLNLSINPGKLAGINKDYEFNMNSYSNKYGFDIVFLSCKTLKGQQTINGKTIDIAKGTVNQNAMNMNFYYAFNNRRFSYPAAFSQTYIQKKSAGSFMIGASFDGTWTRVNKDAATTDATSKLNLVEFAIGAGYGYNLVAGRHWLFHLSALPTFCVYVHSKLENNGQEERMKYSFPSVILTGRGAAVYSWRNKFAGITMICNASNHGSKTHLQILRSKWMLRTMFGFRF